MKTLFFIYIFVDFKSIWNVNLKLYVEHYYSISWARFSTDCWHSDGYHCINYAPPLFDLFLYSCKADFMQGILKKPTIKMLARSFILKFSYINDILSLNNSKYGDFVDRIYPIDLEIRDTTGAAIGHLHTLTYISKLTE